MINMIAGCESNLLFFGATADRRYQAELRQENGARPRPEDTKPSCDKKIRPTRDKSATRARPERREEARPQIEDNCVRAWIYDSIKVYK
jgi:hypothetical protein